MVKKSKLVFNPNAIRVARKQARIYAGEIAEQLNVTEQQVYNYEKGVSSISADALGVVANMTNKPIDFFYNK